MSGGHATAAGIEYQAQVGAWIASHVLTSQAISEVDVDIPLSFQMESIFPIDDIHVTTKSGGHWFINVKTNVPLSTKESSTLSSVVDQFVRQWFYGVVTGSSKRGIDPLRDRLVLVVKPSQSKPLVNGLNPVIKRCIDNHRNASNSNAAYSDEQSDARDAFLKLLKANWLKHKGTDISCSEIAELLACVRLIEFELAGSRRAVVALLLESIIEASQTNLAIDTLVNACIGFSKSRSGGDVETLKTLFSRYSIPLKVKSSFRGDIQKLMESTDAALNDLSRYSSIFVKDSEINIPLQRKCIQAVIDAITKKTSFLVIGNPGSGKSGALYWTAKSLISKGKTVLILQVDQLTSISLEGLQTELTLNHSLIDILREWRPANDSVLIIDALDASRGTGSDPTIRALITQLKVRAPHWTVVASIRKFDLLYGRQYKSIFAGSPLNECFQDSDFPDINHILIPTLSEEEVAEVRSSWENLHRIASESGSEFQSLLSSPFNLYLLGRIITDQSISNPAATQLDLLSQFWAQRVEHGCFVEVEESNAALENLSRKMLEVRRLSVNVRDITHLKASALEILLHNGVLYRTFQSNLVSFSHHTLFDFAIAKLIYQEGQRSIGEKFSLVANDILLVTPAFMLVLRMVWEEDHSRCKYWKLALQIGSDLRFGSFIKALPSRVAADAIKNTSDVMPLLQTLSDYADPLKENASLLLRHLLNVLLANVISNVPNFRDENNPWCEIVALSAKSSIKTLQWPINIVINNWIDKVVTNRDMSFLGEVARILMRLQLTDESSYNEASIGRAIKTTIKTFKSNPKESELLIRELLEPSRVIEKGHKELFWLAHEFSELSLNNEKLAADFFVAAFTTPLPSQNEATNVGNSKILSLRSNKKQDFESVLYILKGKLASFFELSPDCAGNAFKDIVSKGVRSSSLNSQNNFYGKVFYAGSLISFWQDQSCIWWGVEPEYYDNEPEIVEIFCTTLSQVSDADFEKILKSVLRNDIPAVVVAACMRAGTYRANPGSSLELVLSKDVLTMLDTSYDAAQLLTKHFCYLSRHQKDKFEEIIDSITEDHHRKLILLTCIPLNEVIKNPTLLELREKNSSRGYPRNEPHFKIESYWNGQMDNYGWLKSKGVDTESSVNKPLLAKAYLIKTKDLPLDAKMALIELEGFWLIALSLIEDLSKASPYLSKFLKDYICHTIAEVITHICQRTENEIQLGRFSSIREAINFCLNDDLNPPTVHNVEREKKFEEFYYWENPAPRIVASAALMSYIRVCGKADEIDRKLILKLARDPAVEVRNSILSSVSMICLADQQTSKFLALIAFTEEKNAGVLKLFLKSFNNLLENNIDWAPKYLFALNDRLSITSKSSRNDPRRILTILILKLWFNWGHSEANIKINDWIAEPLTYREQVMEIIVNLRGLVASQKDELNDSKSAKMRSYARSYLHDIVKTLASVHKVLILQAEAGAEVKVDLIAVTRMLDSVALQLYHGSGAYSQSKKNKSTSDSVINANYGQFLEEYSPSLKILATVPYPSVIHRVLEIIEVFMVHKPSELLELYFVAVQVGGMSSGYHFEGMGADLVVRIARKYIADYQDLLSGNEIYRHQLLEVLNNFAEVGWPEARKMVYQLPMMLR